MTSPHRIRLTSQSHRTMAAQEGSFLALGIDTGGTHTDAAVVEHPTGRVVSSAKALTTYGDLAIGILEAVDRLDTPLTSVSRVCLSTTLATNTIVEGLGAQVGLLLLGLNPHALTDDGRPARLPDCRRAVIPGRMSVHGEEEEPLGLDQLRQVIADWDGTVGAVAVCGLFAVRNPVHEIAVRRIVNAERGLPVVCSHELSGRLDAITRAATSVLNARLLPVAHRFLAAVRPALSQRGLAPDTPILLVRGDGTLMTEAMGRARPLETYLSGPASSAIGAAHLARTARAAVIDVGGTTSDITLLSDGEALLSDEGALVGGFRTHVPGVHGVTLGLGGDSHVRPGANGALSVGPSRAVPVCLAVEAMGLPAERALARTAWAVGGMPDFIVLGGPPPAGRVTARERVLLELAARGPVSVEEAAQALGLQSPRLLPLERLVAHRALLPVGPTPTDLLAGAGRTRHLSGPVAEHVARCVARGLGCSLEELADRVLDSMAGTLSEGVARACLDHSAPGYVWERGAELVLGHRSDRNGGLLRIIPSLGGPVVGVGAPARHVVPGVAARLSTECVVPDCAAVAGAVGAAVASVCRVVTATVRPVFEVEGITHYAVSSPWPREVYQERAAALARASEIAKRGAVEDLAAGAPKNQGNITVEVAVEEKRAQDSFGADIWLETVVRATAKLEGPPAREP